MKIPAEQLPESSDRLRLKVKVSPHVHECSVVDNSGREIEVSGLSLRVAAGEIVASRGVIILELPMRNHDVEFVK